MPSLTMKLRHKDNYKTWLSILNVYMNHLSLVKVQILIQYIWFLRSIRRCCCCWFTDHTLYSSESIYIECHDFIRNQSMSVSQIKQNYRLKNSPLKVYCRLKAKKKSEMVFACLVTQPTLGYYYWLLAVRDRKMTLTKLLKATISLQVYFQKNPKNYINNHK